MRCGWHAVVHFALYCILFALMAIAAISPNSTKCVDQFRTSPEKDSEYHTAY